MLEWLLDFDAWLFHLINPGIHNVVFDWILPIFRDKFFWIPFYAFLIFFFLFNYSLRKALLFILAILVAITLSDQLSSNLIKRYMLNTRICSQSWVA